MSFPLTEYGRREIVLGTIICALLLILTLWLYWPTVLIPVILWGFLLAFFRDPPRPCTATDGELLSPADGTVADIDEVEAPAYLDGPAVRIGIFMSIFNAHVNRVPRGGRVAFTEYHPGSFRDARSEASKKHNEHNFIGVETDSGHRILVNQIAGMVARRIVCAVEPGDGVQTGERLGMIKFGSRVELYIPADDLAQIETGVGERVKAGRDVLGVLQFRGGNSND